MRGPRQCHWPGLSWPWRQRSRQTPETFRRGQGQQTTVPLVFTLLTWNLFVTAQQKVSKWISAVLSPSLMTPTHSSQWPVPSLPFRSDCREGTSIPHSLGVKRLKAERRFPACAPQDKGCLPFSVCHSHPLSLCLLLSPISTKHIHLSAPSVILVSLSMEAP